MIITVSFPIPEPSEFTYEDPTDSLRPGQRVSVPFGNKRTIGFVTAINQPHPDYPLKAIHSILDEEPIFTNEQFDLAIWMKTYYFASLGEVLNAMFPVNLSSTSVAGIALKQLPDNPLFADHPVFDLLKKEGQLSLQKLKAKFPDTDFTMLISKWTKEGWIIPTSIFKQSRPEKVDGYTLGDKFDTEHPPIFKTSKQRDAYHQILTQVNLLHHGISKKELFNILPISDLAINKMISLGILKKIKVNRSHSDLIPEDHIDNFRFTKEQQQVWESLQSILIAQKFQPTVLFGVTGSGKTFLYMAALQKVLEQGKSGLILVPEIALTPQTVARFTKYFGNKIGVIHSKISESERMIVWKRILSGEINIVIGPRSALFAPLQNIGLIIVDEEHESSYKQFEPSPRYHARDAAIYRAKLNQCPIILGSATPSFESFYHAINGKYAYLTLTERADHATLPDVKIIDMKKEKSEHVFDGPISPTLLKAIDARLKKNEGVILLINRRGYASFVACSSCAWIDKCPKCDISLTWHKTSKNMRCHYCGFTSRPKDSCPKCRSFVLDPVGYGSQQIEEYLAGIFPDAGMFRMDQDTVTGKHAHFQILDGFKKRPGSILLGTQMIAKGLDFHHVTLVGVVQADMGLLIPDFRATERTFQLLSQVAGRSGRGKKAGEVLIQTWQATHPVFSYVKRHDFEGNYQSLIQDREVFQYPPFRRTILFEVKSPDRKEALLVIEKLKVELQDIFPDGEWKGPADPVIERLNNWYRQHLFVFLPKFGGRQSGLYEKLMTLQLNFKKQAGKNCRLIIDTDPMG